MDTVSYSPNSKFLVAFGVLLLAALFVNFGTVELEAEEPRRAIVALEMILQNNWVVPTLHGETYYNKPPLFNWVLIGSFSLFGTANEWAVRLPALLSYLLIAAFTFWLARPWVGQTAAFLSALAWLTFFELLYQATNISGEIDLFFSLLICLQAGSIFVFSQRKKWLWLFIATYAFTAIGFLTKGLPALVFLAFTLLPWLVVQGHFRKLFSWQHAVGILCFLLILLPYGYLYAERQPLLPFLLNLVMESSQRTPAEYSFGKSLSHWLSFPLQFWVILLPWSLLLFLWKKETLQKIRQNPFLLFCSVFLLGNILPYWLSPGLRKPYLYMFLPFAACLLLFLFSDFLQHPFKNKASTKAAKLLNGLWLAFPIILILAGLGLPFVEQFTPLPYRFPTAVFLVATNGLLLWWMISQPQKRLLALLLCLLVGKTGYNLVVKPFRAEYSEARVFRKHINEVLRITKGQPVYFYAQPTPDINRFLGVSDTLSIPPHIPYGIPYYLTKGNGHLMLLEQKALPDRFYLSRVSYIKSLKTKEWYRFNRKSDHWVLFTLEKG